jgi:signal transduction histidine kinase
VSEFLVRNIVLVYFFYGLSFFSMGLAILVESGHASELDFAKALLPLGGFGIVHGCHEWLEMFLLLHLVTLHSPNPTWLQVTRQILLASSFLMLLAFGLRLIAGKVYPKIRRNLFLVVITIWLIGCVWVLSTSSSRLEETNSLDVYTRYALAIPGAALTTWGLLIQREKFKRTEMERFGRDVAIAAIAFALYGGIGQLFAAPSSIFPSRWLNYETFLQWFGIPIQVFRASMACLAAVFIIRSLRAFEEENRRAINSLREAQMLERKRLDSLRSELLHRTVKAQENERQRIARELHDETGQTLTALAMGLQGLTNTIEANPAKAIDQARQLQSLAGAGISELQRLVSGLHPPQLDDLGLAAALRWFAGQVHDRFGLQVRIHSESSVKDLPMEIRIVLFRIAQEAVTNAVRHANASEVDIFLTRNEHELCLKILDNGEGFDIESKLKPEHEPPCWGLMGMIERASLINARCQITSKPRKGTTITVDVPMSFQTATDKVEPHA